MADYSVISRSETAPPVTPEEGAKYIVAVGGSGVWVGWDNSVAHFANAAWEEIVPASESVAVIEDEELTVVYKGSPDYWVEWEPWRERLTAPRTYYVRDAGDDVTGDGLSVGTAVNSISKAIEIAAALDTNNFDVTIDADEVRAHTSSVVLQRLFGGGAGYIAGMDSTNSIINLGSGIAIDAQANGLTGVGEWEIDGFSITGACKGIEAYGQCQIVIGNDIDFNCTSTHISAGIGSLIKTPLGNTSATFHYKISSGGLTHIYCTEYGIIDITGKVTISTPTFSNAFIEVRPRGIVNFTSIVTGSAIGDRFMVRSGGYLDSFNLPPGNVNGEIKEGGIFVKSSTPYVANHYRNNRTATTDPTVNDDADDYYAVGSKWTNVTLDRIFECVDATVGAAIWRPVGIKHNFAATVVPAVTDDADDFYQIGSRWLIPTTQREFLLTDDAAGAAVWQEVTTQLGKNFVYNPAFRVAQRGTSFAPTTIIFMLDRWKANRASNVAGSTWSRQAGFSGADYCMRMQRDAANAATDILRILQQVPSVVARNMRGMPVTLSVYARHGADWSPSDLKLLANIWTGTGVDETANIGTGFATGSVNNALSGQLVGATEARIIFPTVVLASDLNELAFRFSWTPVGTAGAADYVEITMVKLEIGYDATPFIHDTEKVTRDECLFFYEAKSVRSENGARHIPLVTKRIVPTIVVGVGSSGNVTVDGFELTHSAAATCSVTADAEI